MGAFRDRRVLISGASSGIGRAAARMFAAEGARVLAIARSPDRLEALSRETAGRAVALAADVTDGDAMRELAQRVLDDHGAPDVIVANAGIGLDARFERTSDEALTQVLDVNVVGVVRTVRPFLPEMLRRRSGRILFVSSIVGKRGIPHYSAYSASKFALHGMADALRVELLGSGVTLGVVCPSSTTTEFHDRLLREGPPQRHVRPRRHSAESVARAILRMARSRRREMVLTSEARLLVLADRLVPGLVDRLLARMLLARKD